jgi:hypothetical protein
MKHLHSFINWSHHSAMIAAVCCALLPSKGLASAGLPSVSFAPELPLSFFQAVTGDSDSFYALLENRQIVHLDKDGRKLADFQPALEQSSSITNIARDGAGNLFITGTLVPTGATIGSNVLKLRPDGSVVKDFGSVLVTAPQNGIGGLPAQIGCIVADEQGGCWVASGFSAINSTPADGLAHIDATGRVTVADRLKPHQDTPRFLARAPDGIIVIEGYSIYKLLDAGGLQVIETAGPRWIGPIIAASYNARFGLVVAAHTQTVARCFAYGSDGKPLSSFLSSAGFVRGPTQLAWDHKGRLLLSSAQLSSATTGPVPESFGVKRLLSDGSVDGSWNQSIDIYPGLQTVVPLSDSVIVSGPFERIGDYQTAKVGKLSGEDMYSRLVNQSVLGWVAGGSQQMILGVIIRGDYVVQALVRACGPSLSQFGISKTPSQTYCRVYHGDKLVYTFAPGRDGMASGFSNPLQPAIPYSESGSIAAASKAAGAFPLATRGFDEAEGLVNLAPGLYTIVFDIPSGQTGQVLAEIYYP